jgi:hypothetical protein
MTKSLYENPDVSKVLAMYEEYRQFVITSTNELQKLAKQYEEANQKFVNKYQENMKEYLERVKEDVVA